MGAEETCLAWDWQQENGVLEDMVCRGLMLVLHRTGEKELPLVRQRIRNPLVTEIGEPRERS